MKNRFLILLCLVSILFVGCNNKEDFASQTSRYTAPTRQLEIAMIGTNPFEKVKNITYTSIKLEDLLKEKDITFDALIVTKEYFSLAATSEYQNYFIRIKVPVFFVGTQDILAGVFRDPRLTMKDVKIDNFGNYASGFVFINGRYQDWGFGLPENPTEKDIKIDLILRISKVVQMFNNGEFS